MRRSESLDGVELGHVFAIDRDDGTGELRAKCCLLLPNGDAVCGHVAFIAHDFVVQEADEQKVRDAFRDMMIVHPGVDI